MTGHATARQERARARELRRVLTAEAWNNERVINHFRAGAWLAIGGVEWLMRTQSSHDHLTAMPVLFVGWGVCVLALNQIWLRRDFHGAVAPLLTLGDTVILTLGVRVVHQHNLVAHPGVDAAREVTEAGLGLMLVVAVNMVRFSWKYAVASGLTALTAYLYLLSMSGTLAVENLSDVLLFGCLVGLLVYTTRRFHNILEDVMIASRRAQEDRVASLSAMVAGVAHEMNTPLGALASGTQVTDHAVSIVDEALRDDESASLRQRYPKLQRALTSLADTSRASAQAVERISSVVRSLRSFARLDEGEMQYFDVREGVSTCLELLRPDCGQRIVVHTHFEEVPCVEGRPAQMNQVFMHVLRNAVQAIDADGSIDVSVRPDGDEVLVEVADTGRGIEPERLSRLFDPAFTHAGPRTKVSFGLTTSQGIVHDHGGNLAIDSTPGRGTRVSIQLPAVNA